MTVRSLKKRGLDKFFGCEMLLFMLFISPAHALDEHFAAGYIYIDTTQELSQNGVAEIALADLNKMDSASRVISQNVISYGSENLFPYYPEHDRSKWSSHFRYALKVRIGDAPDELIAVNGQQHQFNGEVALLGYDVLIRKIKWTTQKPEQISLECSGSVFLAKVYSGFIVLSSMDNRKVKIFVQVPAASGTRYVRGDTELWLKGREGFIVKPGYEKQPCRVG